MKAFLTIILAAVVSCTVAIAAEPIFPTTSPSVVGQPENGLHAGSQTSVLPIPGLPRPEQLPGVELAAGISQITGMAISPLWGVSSVGAWRYYHTPQRLRESLPWFCHPGIWGLGFALLSLCFLKDVVGTVMPPFIKKPLDIVELFECKLSALVVMAGVVPSIIARMVQQVNPTQAGLSLPSHVCYASVLPLPATTFDLYLLFVPLGILSFLVVWMTCHAINVLIALCPFGFIDTLLKLLKTALLSAIILSYIVNPYLGASVSLIFVFVAALIAPMAFRLTVFGTLFAADTIAPWYARKLATPTEAHAFFSRKIVGVPARTYGRVVRGSDGTIYFCYHPWLILPRRKVQLPVGTFALAKGVYFPSLLHCQELSDTFTRIIIFLPRYRSHERTIANHFGITDVRDNTIVKGFKAVKAWLSEILGLVQAPLRT